MNASDRNAPTLPPPDVSLAHVGLEGPGGEVPATEWLSRVPWDVPDEDLGEMAASRLLRWISERG